MEIKDANIAAMSATLPTASERSVVAVTDAYRTRLENYLASMLQAKRMLSMGIITPEDYAIIDTMQSEKFGISSCSLYRGVDLIYNGFRGNMSHYKEVTKCQKQ
ncbi:MAG: SHOCT domain-containing protein [Faecousia sp.]